MLLVSRAALGIAGDTDGAVGLDGSLRTITLATRNYRIAELGDLNPPRSVGQSQTLLRLVLQGYPTDWLRYEIHGVQDLTLESWSSPVGGTDIFRSGASAAATRYRRDADWHFADEDGLDATVLLDRANVRLALPALDVTIGRQAITFGKAYFWNPLDVFFPFDPTTFDRDYKPGVDAVRLDVPLGDFSGITLVEAVGHGPSVDQPYNSAILGRAFANLWDWDFAVQGGKVYGGYHVGGATAGEVVIDDFGIDARAEAAYFVADNDRLPRDAMALPGGLTGVLGLGHMFEGDLLVSAEYLYNGMARGGLDDGLRLLQRGLVPSMSEQVAGVVASYPITGLLQGSAAALVSLSDASVLLQPGIVYSAADEVEIVGGALLAFGARPTIAGLKTEFGTYPHVFYSEIKAYF